MIIGADVGEYFKQIQEDYPIKVVDGENDVPKLQNTNPIKKFVNMIVAVMVPIITAVIGFVLSFIFTLIFVKVEQPVD